MGLGNSRDYPRTYIGTDAPTHGEEIWIDSDATPLLDADLDCAEYDLDNVGNIIHDEATASDFIIQNVDLDKDIIFNCNDGSSQTDIMILDGSAGQLSGIIKATAGVLAGATDGTDYISSVEADQTPQLYADLDCQEHNLDNVGDIIHDDATASDMTIKNEDQDKDMIFNCNDGGVDTMIMTLDGSAGQLSGIVKATSGVLGAAVPFTDYMPVLVPYRGIDALRTLDATDYFVDCTANSFDVTLPSASGIAGRVYIIKNSGTGSIGVKPTGAEKIDGLSEVDLVTQYASITVIADGTNWKIV